MIVKKNDKYINHLLNIYKQTTDSKSDKNIKIYLTYNHKMVENTDAHILSQISIKRQW